MKIQYICQLCSQDLKYAKTLRKHINENHKEVDEVEYYLKYLAKDKEENLCKVCRKPLRTDGKRFSFLGFRRPFHRGCVQTEKYYVIKYGEELGKQKWQEYRKIQGKTNSLEYKKEKYGMTEEEFKEYNKSRAVTLKNLTKKYGEEEGKRRFEIYREKQKYVGSCEEYFIEKFGEELGKQKWKEVNKSKGVTLENYIKRLGKEKGTEEFNKRIQRKTKFYSKMSSQFFEDLIKRLGRKEHIYFGENEFGKYNPYTGGYVKFDFTDTLNHKIIEFNGDNFHPKEEHDKNFKNVFNKEITSEMAWQRDRQKEIIANENGFKIYYIWEHEVNENYEIAIQKCLEFLKCDLLK